MGRVRQQAPAPTRLDALDALRGLAALGIVVLHVWMFDYGDAHRPEKGLLELSIGELRLGVPLFFVLSGFLLYRPFVASALDGRTPPRLTRYAIRRAARIVPAYWLALLVAFLLLRHLAHPSQAQWSELPVFALFLQNYFVETLKHLDPPMWTLGVEVAFYAALPLVGWLGLRLARTRTRQALLCAGLAIAGAVVAGIAMVGRWEPTLSNSLLTHTHEFAAGMLVAVAVHGRRSAHRTALALLAAGALLVVADGVWHARGMGSLELRRALGDTPAVAGFALIVAALATTTLRLRVLASAPLRLLGTLSYSVYLLHFLAIYWLRSEPGRWPEHLGWALLATLGVTIPASVASWLLIERPALVWAQRATRGRRPAADAQPQSTPSRAKPAAAYTA